MIEEPYNWLNEAIATVTDRLERFGMEFFWLPRGPADKSSLSLLQNKAKNDIDGSLYQFLSISDGVEIQYGDPLAEHKWSSDAYRIIPIHSVDQMINVGESLRALLVGERDEGTWDPYWPIVDLQDSNYLASTAGSTLGEACFLPIDIHTGPEDWILRKSDFQSFHDLLRGFFDDLMVRPLEPGLPFVKDFFYMQADWK